MTKTTVNKRVIEGKLYIDMTNRGTIKHIAIVRDDIHHQLFSLIPYDFLWAKARAVCTDTEIRIHLKKPSQKSQNEKLKKGIGGRNYWYGRERIGGDVGGDF